MDESILLILADKRLPADCLKQLASTGPVYAFETLGVTYDAISCHPDIFVFDSPTAKVLAPNCPGELSARLSRLNIEWLHGKRPVGMKYPQTAPYNAFADDDILVYSPGITDESIVELCSKQQKIAVKQAYIRCNLLKAGKNRYITSDKGIEKALKIIGLDVFYQEPRNILLPGFPYGFIGGCAGLFRGELYFTGSLDSNSDFSDLKQWLIGHGIVYHCLYAGRPVDGGGLFFITHPAQVHTDRV